MSRIARSGNQSRIFDDLEAEQDALEEVLDGLDNEGAQIGSLCPGWSVSDVVLHLAQTEEAVVASVTGADAAPLDAGDASNIDELMERWVASQRGAPFEEVRARWSKARRAAVEAMRAADPNASLTWAAAPLKPRTLATTRLSEHWIHAQDIVVPLEISYPDADRLWHIAWLAHRSIPYAFMWAGRDDAPAVHAHLESPAGETWEFGSTDAPCRIEGSAGEFCRVAARRVAPDRTSLAATGERADVVLALLRTYA